MKTKFKQWLSGAWSVIWKGVLSFFQDLVKKKFALIVTILLGTVGTVGTVSGVIPGFITHIYNSVAPDNQTQQAITTLREDVRQLSQDFKSADQTNHYEDDMFRESLLKFIGQMEKRHSQQLKHLQDSLSEMNKRIVSYERGSGTVTIAGGGTVKDGQYSDHWLKASVEIDSLDNVKMDYEFQFGLSDVTVEVEDKSSGAKTEVYSVWLQSLIDSSVKYYVGDYRREVVALSKVPEVEPEVQQSTINLDLAYSGYGVEASASYSLWTWGNFKLPEIGIGSDFENSANIYGGVRYNVGSFLPVFTDLWLSLKYGYNFIQQKNGVIVGLGTTL